MVVIISITVINLLLLVLLWQTLNPIKHFTDPAFLLDASGRIKKSNTAFKNLQNQFFPRLNKDNVFNEITGLELNNNYPWDIHDFPVKIESKKFKLSVFPFRMDQIVCIIYEDTFSELRRTILHRLIHDAKGPMSTVLMALHNLNFITHQKDTFPDQDGIDEFLIPAQEASKETSRRIQNAVLFSKNKPLKNQVVNLNEIVTTTYKRMSETILIHLIKDNKIDFTLCDEKTLEMALEELTRFSAFMNNNQQAVNIKTIKKLSSDDKAQTEIHIFSEGLGKEPKIPKSNELLGSKILTDFTQPILNMALILLYRNQVTFYGYIIPETGSYFRLIFKNLEE